MYKIVIVHCFGPDHLLKIHLESYIPDWKAFTIYQKHYHELYLFCKNKKYHALELNYDR